MICRVSKKNKLTYGVAEPIISCVFDLKFWYTIKEIYVGLNLLFNSNFSYLEDPVRNLLFQFL